MRYRRADVAGGIYFFTTNLAERKRASLVDYVAARMARQQQDFTGKRIALFVENVDHLGRTASK